MGLWQLPPQLHLTTHCIIQNTKTLALGTSDGACHLLRLDSSSSNSSSSSSSGSGVPTAIPGALLRLQTPRLLPAPISAKPSVLLALVQQQQQGQGGRTPAAVPSAAARCALSLSRLAQRAAAGGVTTVQRNTAGLAAARAAAAAAAMGGCGIACLSHQDTALEQLLLFAVRNGLFGGWDLRTASPLFAAHAPPWLGAPSAQAIGTDGRWAVLGTTGGLLLQFDLRMQLPLRAWLLQPPVPIKQLLFVDPSAAAIAMNSNWNAANTNSSSSSSTWGQQGLQHQDRSTCCMLALLQHEGFPLLLLDLHDGLVLTAYNTSCFAGATATAAAAAAAGGGAAGPARDRLPRLVPLPMEALRLPSACSHLLPSPGEVAALRGTEGGALHMPCCLWGPPPLRGAAGFVLSGGEDLCVHYWDLAEEQATFAAKLAEQQQQQQRQQHGGAPGGATTGNGEATASSTNLPLLDNDLVRSYCVLGPRNACGCRGKEDTGSITASLSVEGVRVLQHVCCRSAPGKRLMLHAAAAGGRGTAQGEAGSGESWETLRSATYRASEGGDASPRGAAETGYRGQGRGLMMMNSTSSNSGSSTSLGVSGRCCCAPPPSVPGFASWAPTWTAEDDADSLPGFTGPSPMHRDAIIGLAAIGQEDLFLATAGRDGVVKIWS